MVTEIDGRGERIRTSDPLLPKQVLYQAEPLPELWLETHLMLDSSCPGPVLQRLAGLKVRFD